jgi:1-acyl-sn-glycerol-3-phosphate acyltransferase
MKIRPGAVFGKPLDFSQYYGRESDRDALRAVTDEIMHAIHELSDQEYVDEYIKKSRKPSPEPESAPAPASAAPDAQAD